MPKFLILRVCCLVLLPASVPAAEPAEIPHSLPEEIQFTTSTARAFDRSGEYVTSEKRADGTVYTGLNGSFQNVTVARLGPDGTIETYCTTEEDDARNWMARQDSGSGNSAVSRMQKDQTP